jgi:NodT family efflux transporter outer membrane factor (OMF) lipoprotein
MPRALPTSLAAVLATTLMLEGCLGPRPAPPPEAAVTAPPAWRTPSAEAPPLASDWWQGFGDPVLSELVEQALAHNAEIGEAAARVAQARAHLRLAHAEQGPEVDFHGVGGYTQQLEVTGPISTWGAETDGVVSYDFDLFHKLANASKAARAQLLATQAARDAMRLAVASTTAQTYITLLGADRRLAIAQDTLKARADALHLEQRLVGSGYSSQLDLHQAEAEYRATQQLVPMAQLAVTEAENALSVLIDQPPQAITRGTGGLDALHAPQIAPGLPSQLLRRRPDIMAAEQSAIAADRSLDSARAAMLPDLALTGSAGKIFAAVLPTPESVWLIGGSVLAPIFDSGRRKANADTVAAQRDEAAWAYRATVLEAFKEVENALASVQRVEEQRKALAAQVTAEQGALKVATQRYRAGYAAYIDQIDAERALLSAQLSLAQSDSDRLNDYVQLYRALGGGWRAETPS